MEFVAQTIVNSLVASSFYALIAVGLSLLMGVMKTANYAHGEFYMVGAYVVWLLYSVGNLPFPAAVVAALGVGAAMGIVTERIIFRPLRGKLISGFIISVGLVFILQVSVGQIWGVGKPKPVPVVFPGSLDLFGVTVSWQRLVAVGVAVAMLAGVLFFLHRVKLGQALRASAQDPDAASLQGISINRTSTIAMIIASAMAAVAGAVMAPIMSVTPYMGHMIIWICFVVIVVGGPGDIRGTILASIILGFINTVVTTLLDSTIAAIVSSLFMLSFLAARPQGLAGYAKN